MLRAGARMRVGLPILTLAAISGIDQALELDDEADENRSHRNAAACRPWSGSE